MYKRVFLHREHGTPSSYSKMFHEEIGLLKKLNLCVTMKTVVNWKLLNISEKRLKIRQQGRQRCLITLWLGEVVGSANLLFRYADFLFY